MPADKTIPDFREWVRSFVAELVEQQNQKSVARSVVAVLLQKIENFDKAGPFPLRPKQWQPKDIEGLEKWQDEQTEYSRSVEAWYERAGIEY